MARRRPPAPVPGQLMGVHPDWTVRVAGMAAAGVCAIRPATLPDISAAGRLLDRAEYRQAAARQAAGRTLLLLAWMDPDRVSGTGGPGGPDPGGAAGGLRVVGCVEIDWTEAAEDGPGVQAGDRVRLGHLHVEPAVRRLGVARALVSAAEAHCRAAGRLRVVADLTSGPGGDAVTSLGVVALAAGSGYAPFPATDRPADGSPVGDGPVGGGSVGGGGGDRGGGDGGGGGAGDGGQLTAHAGWWWKDLEQAPSRSGVVPVAADRRSGPAGRPVPIPAHPTRARAAGGRPL